VELSVECRYVYVPITLSCCETNTRTIQFCALLHSHWHSRILADDSLMQSSSGRQYHINNATTSAEVSLCTAWPQCGSAISILREDGPRDDQATRWRI